MSDNKRALPVAEPLCTWPSCNHTAKGQCRAYSSGQLLAPNDASITATNTTVAEPEPQAVRVKPLVAGRHPRGFIATDHGGGAAYIFALNGGRYECIKGLAHSPRFDTSKEALAAAQADHDARILSQIEAVSVAQVRAEVLEEAAAKATSFLVGDPQNGVPLRNPMAHEIAASIRALIEKEPA